MPRTAPRFLRSLFALALLLVVGAGALRAQSAFIGAPEMTFTPAGSGARTSLDIGGVWNSATNTEVTTTTGDSITLVYTNTGGATAFDLSLDTVLPANVEYVPGSISYSSTTTIPGNTITTNGIDTSVPGTLRFRPGTANAPAGTGFDLEAGATLTINFGIRATTAATAGTVPLTHGRLFATTNGGALSVGPFTTSQPLLIRAGDTIITSTTTTPVRALGQDATFTLTVTNTGLGGVFDATIDESAIGAGLSLVSLTPVSPAVPAPVVVSATQLRIPYLAPGETFVATAVATVVDCDNIVNLASSVHRADSTAVTTSLPIELDFTVPLVAVTAPAVTLDYITPVTVTVNIQNTGLGNARSFTLDSSLESLPLTVSNVSAGWTYTPATGVFTRTATSGAIGIGANVELTFDVTATDICTSSGAGTVRYNTAYTNDCGDPYSIPLAFGTINPPTNTPTLTLTKDVTPGSISVGGAGTFTLTLSATNLANLSGTDVVVQEVLPPEVILATVVPSIGTWNSGTQQWTVPLASLGAAQTLTIPFMLLDDPCLGGRSIVNSASTSVVTVRGCTLNPSANATFVVPNVPADSSSSAPAGVYETGTVSADNIRTGDEGDFAPFQSSYGFQAGYPGTWAGSTFENALGDNTNISRVGTTLTVSGVRVSTNAPLFTNVVVPSGSITNLPTGGFRIDLGFLAGAAFFNGANISDSRIIFNYQVNATDAVTGGAASATITTIPTLQLANVVPGPGVDPQCSTTLKTQFADFLPVTFVRAVASVAITAPATIEVCKDELVTLTVSNANNAQPSRNLRVTFQQGAAFAYDTAFTPVYGGAFNAGNITYADNGGDNPTFTYTGGTLPANGTIQVRVRRIYNGNTTTTGFSSLLEYDSRQTETSPARDYSATGNYSPNIVFQATLAVTTTPASVTVTGPTVAYTIFVTNTNAGAAYNTVLTDVLPVGLTINKTLTDAANASAPYFNSPVTVGGQTGTWNLGTLASGNTLALRVVADVGSTCTITINPAVERISAQWGCEPTNAPAASRPHPAVVLPDGKLQALHDSTLSRAILCGNSQAVIVVKNTGVTFLENVSITETITGGASLSLGSPVTYTVTSGTGVVTGPFTAAPTGPAGGPYVWTATQISQLASLSPVGDTGPNQITITLPLNSTEDLAAEDPVLTAIATGSDPCGSNVTSPGFPFDLPVERPDITVAKTGRNVTAGDVAYTETVYAGAGDVIEWRIIVANDGTAATNVRISDLLSGAASASATISGPGIAGSPAYTSGTVLPVSDVPANSTATYLITETLGASCVNAAPEFTVIWGCTPIGSISTPTDNTDTANLDMTPSAIGGTNFTQSVTSLPGGRARVRVTLTNNGGTLHNPVLTATIPVYALHDITGPVTIVDTTADITSVSRTGGTDAAPVFTFSGPGAPHILRFGETISFEYHVQPTIFDPNQATGNQRFNIEGTGSSLDPAIPATANVTNLLSFTNSCGTALSSTLNAPLPLLRPDLDVTSAPVNNIVATTTGGANYDFQIRNVGSPGSVANFIRVVVRVGKGWSFAGNPQLTSPGGTAVPGLAAPVIDATDPDFTLYTYTLPDGFTLTRPVFGDTPILRVRLPNATALDNGASLIYEVEPRGESRAHDNNTVLGDYSLDRRGSRILGVDLALDILSTSEPASTDTLPSTANVLIGEEITYRARAKVFGAHENVTAPILRITHGDTNNNPHLGLGYVSHALTAGNLVTPSSVTTPLAPVGTPASIADARVSFNWPTLAVADIAAGQAIFETDFTTRVLNLADNADNKPLRNNLAVQLVYLGVGFRSSSINNADDGFSGDAGSDALHAHRDVTVRRPAISIVKTARNLTRATAFAPSVSGEFSDVIEYRLVVTNTSDAGERPVRDIRITDTVPAKLNLSAANQGADTNADPDNIEVLNTSGATGQGATITFNQANTAIATAGQNFDRLDPGQSITLLYRGTLIASVTPSESLPNAAAVVGFSIPVDGTDQAINQSVPQGTAVVDNPPAAATAALRLDAAAAAFVVIDEILQNKTIQASSVAASVDPLVFIGEQLRYRISLTIPQGTVPELIVTDTLPDGLALIGTPVVSIGASLVPATPGTLTVNDQELTWAFGQIVADGADRSITIEYVAQVRNTAGNVAGTDLVNNATYSFTGSPINLNEITVTVAEPAVTVVHQVRNVTRDPLGPFGPTADADAGDVLEYRVALTNPPAAGRAPAYDLAFADTLAAGLTYVVGSTVTEVATGLTGTLVEPDVAGQVLTWGRTQTAPADLDLAIGADNFEFRYRATVDDTSAPLQVYTNAFVADWTSLDGDPAGNHPILAPENIALEAPGEALGERTGTGVAPNTYRSELSTTVTALDAATLLKTKSGDTLPIDAPASGFRVGDLVTYTLTVDLQEGTYAGFTLADTLPAGLAFHETVSITPDTGADGFTYTTPASPATAPTLGATGALAWDFGTLVNTGDNDDINDTLVLVYSARVIDPAGVPAPAAAPDPATTALDNSATLAYLNGASEPLTKGPSVAAIAVAQPRVLLTKTRLAPVADNLVMPGDPATFRLTVTNDGAAPAYNLALADTLPAGLRAATPVVAAATLNGVDISGTLPAPAYDSGTGLWTLTLADDQPLLPGSQTFVIDYTVTVDAAATKGAVLTNSALVTAYASKPSADADERRVYDPTAPDAQSLVVAMSIDGFVYHQLIPNGVKDPDEDWTSGVAVTVNLVTNDPIALPGFTLAANQVLRTLVVNPGPGDYTFTNVPPGNFRVIVTDTATATAPVAPADWTFDTPDTGSITPLVLTNADLANQNLGLYRARVVSGQVYYDLATYGVKDGGEDWSGGTEVVVNLVNIYDVPVVHESITVPAGVGTFSFTDVPPGPYRLVVAPAGQATAVTASAPATLVFVEPDNGTRTLTVALADHVDQDFGLTPGRTVSGHVYNDIIPNSVRDPGLEDWSGAPAVYVNLVRVSTNTVWASRLVNAGPGDYEFTDVIPGEFRLVVANAPGDITAAPPSSWRFRAPPDGSRLINVAAADILDQDFGLFRGRTVKGQVFRDDGTGGGIPNDGLRNGSEAGLGNVTVRLLSDTGTQLDITQTDGAGNFTLRIPAETLASATLILEELNPGGHRSTGATLGTHGDSYDRATDRIAFTYPDDDVDGLAFGDVPANQLLTDGAQTVLPGATATYRHTYIAGTGGTVVFTLDPSAVPADVPWSHVLHRDNDCDGEVGAGDPVLLGAPITVTAGQEVCLLLLTHAPGGAPHGAVATARLVATFTYDNADPDLDDDELIRQDVTTVGATASAGLELTKAVDKTAARPGEEITYTITYTNVGAEALRELFIYDTTPAYTVFVSASYGLTPASLTGEPIDAPAPDATGAIRWEFTGELEPGGTGTVIFTIRVRQ